MSDQVIHTTDTYMLFQYLTLLWHDRPFACSRAREKRANKASVLCEKHHKIFQRPGSVTHEKQSNKTSPAFKFYQPNQKPKSSWDQIMNINWSQDKSDFMGTQWMHQNRYTPRLNLQAFAYPPLTAGEFVTASKFEKLPK